MATCGLYPNAEADSPPADADRSGDGERAGPVRRVLEGREPDPAEQAPQAGELKKLRIHNVSRSTIARILIENGFDPGPKRGEGTWHDFVRRHVKTLWATDFFTKTVWTLRGPLVYYVLFFIHIHTRRVHVAGMTPNPDGPWMAQQARNMSMIFDDAPGEYKPTHIIRDRDSKFTKQFCSILESDGIEFRPIPARSPNLNPYCESWVGRTRGEVLNHFIVFGEKHLRRILEAWLTHYHFHRPHQGLGNVPIRSSLPPPEPLESFRLEDVVLPGIVGRAAEALRAKGGVGGLGSRRAPTPTANAPLQASHLNPRHPTRPRVASLGSMPCRNCLETGRCDCAVVLRPVDASATGLTNRLYEVALPQQTDPACDLSTPGKCTSPELTARKSDSYHLLWLRR